jgi:hypothetical protein
MLAEGIELLPHRHLPPAVHWEGRRCPGRSPNFRGAESILLKHLADSRLDADIVDAGRPYKESYESPGVALLVSGRVHIENKSTTSGGPSDTVVGLATGGLCAECILQGTALSVSELLLDEIARSAAGTYSSLWKP